MPKPSGRPAKKWRTVDHLVSKDPDEAVKLDHMSWDKDTSAHIANIINEAGVHPGEILILPIVPGVSRVSFTIPLLLYISKNQQEKIYDSLFGKMKAG